MNKVIIILSILVHSVLNVQCSRNDDAPRLVPAPNDTTTLPVDTPDIPERTLTYLALGDSYTIGTGVTEPERFPVQLRNRLVNDGFSIAETQIIATNGWTTANLISATNNFEPDSSFSLVSLLIGVNNQYQGRPIAEYSEQFSILLERAIMYAGGDTSRVIVISIPDYSVTPFGQNMNPSQIAQQIDQFNDVNQSISEIYGVSYYYITDISRQAANDPTLIATDNLHPSGAQYALWISSFYESVKTKLYE
jgi:lysophospholipase L1-like esterase